MRRGTFCFLIMCFYVSLQAQGPQERAKFYLGLSYGTSFAIGDFKDTDVNNTKAGFAEDGSKLDIYGGIFLNERITLTGTFRYQSFETGIASVLSEFNAANPGSNITGSTEDWESYYLLFGVSYKLPLTRKFALYPRVGMGPVLVTNPGITILDEEGTENFVRTSETGLGLGYEAGIGLRRDLGRHFSLMPTFTFSGGFISYANVETTINTIEVEADYEPSIQSFTIGLSIAYRFY